jgi:hypothetical protein
MYCRCLARVGRGRLLVSASATFCGPEHFNNLTWPWATEYASYQKPRPPIRISITRVLGLQASPGIVYRTKPLSRTYMYDFVCDMTRFTHLVTSHLVRRTLGSRGVRTGLQSCIPKVRNSRSAYPACTILPVFAALSLITSQPRYSFFLLPLHLSLESE